MTPFLLRRIGMTHPVAGANKGIGVDEVHQVVVVTDQESEARDAAMKQAGNEGAIWNNPDLVECINLTESSMQGVVCVPATFE